MSGTAPYAQLEGGDPAQKSTSGHVTLTWNGTGQTTNTATLTVPGATGACYGVATAQGVDNGLLAPVPFFTNNNNGTIGLAVQTKGGASPPNGTTVVVAYVIWGT